MTDNSKFPPNAISAAPAIRRRQENRETMEESRTGTANNCWVRVRRERCYGRIFEQTKGRVPFVASEERADGAQELFVGSTSESTISTSGARSPKRPLISFFVGWGLGFALFASSVILGPRPNSPPTTFTELVVGAVIFGLLIGLVAAQITLAIVQDHIRVRTAVEAMLVGMLVGAIPGYLITQEFFGAVWTGLGGALGCGLLLSKMGRCRTNHST